MSCYLFSMDNKPLVQSTTLSRLILDLVRPFRKEANDAFMQQASAKRDAELEQLRKDGIKPGFGDADIEDPLDGLEGVRGRAFVLADAQMPVEFDDALLAGIEERGKVPGEIREAYPKARQFIANQALKGEDVLIY